MRSNAGRAAILVVLVAAAVFLFVALQGSDDDSASETTATSGTTTLAVPPAPETVPVIVIQKGEPVGGVQELEFNKGERIKFTVQSDTAEEIHVHGYDLSKDVGAGGNVSFDFPADIDGAFEVELEHSATPIIDLTVQP